MSSELLRNCVSGQVTNLREVVDRAGLVAGDRTHLGEGVFVNYKIVPACKGLAASRLSVEFNRRVHQGETHYLVNLEPQEVALMRLGLGLPEKGQAMISTTAIVARAFRGLGLAHSLIGMTDLLACDLVGRFEARLADVEVVCELFPSATENEWGQRPSFLDQIRWFEKVAEIARGMGYRVGESTMTKVIKSH